MQLSEGQQQACEFISDFILDAKPATPIHIAGRDPESGELLTMEFNSNQVMVLSGPAGTGKTTVIKHCLEHLAKVHKAKLALGISSRIPMMEFCATTNKAAEAFEHALNKQVEVEEDVATPMYSARTIHSLMNFVMREDPKTLKDVLVSSRPEKIFYDILIFVDEASYVDFQLLYMISTKMGKGCKIIFMGDRFQCKTAGGDLPVFDSGLPTTELTQIMRQANGNPIQGLSVMLRDWVKNGGKTPACPIDNKFIMWMERDKFNAAILHDMSREEWTYDTSKVLAFRNKTVNALNKMVYAAVKGSQELRAHDYAVNNSYVRGMKNVCPSIGTDRMVYIHTIEPGTEFGEAGHWVYSDSNPKGGRDYQTQRIYEPYFMPADKKAIDKLVRRYTKAVQESEVGTTDFIEARKRLDKVKDTWVDLRPVYSQTVHKSQGSTFRRVFIDLSDLSYCFDRDQLRRLLYVAISRAQVQVVLTGDIP